MTSYLEKPQKNRGDRLTDHKIRKAFKAALPITLPVMVGYVVLGLSYGLLMKKVGYGALWSFSLSFFVYAGALQYVGIAILTGPFNPLYTLLMTLAVNFRYIFCGLSMLEKFKGMGKLKPYLIFGLSDETYSLISAMDVPPGIDEKWFYFFITGLNHFYWSAGTVAGALLGFVLKFNTMGLDFALTALFTVMFLDQWKSMKNHIPAIVGVAASVVCLLIFGPGKFIIPAMLAILAILTLLRKYMERR